MKREADAIVQRWHDRAGVYGQPIPCDTATKKEPMSSRRKLAILLGGGQSKYRTIQEGS